MDRSSVFACVAGLVLVAVDAAADERYFGLEVPRQRPEVFAPAVIAAVHPLVATNPAFSGDFRRFAFTAVDARQPDKVALRVYERGSTGSNGPTRSRCSCSLIRLQTAASRCFRPTVSGCISRATECLELLGPI